MKRIYYFGCVGEPGHYTHAPGERMAKFGECPIPEAQIDGRFTPKSTTEQGLYTQTQQQDWLILAWHDYTVDKRLGSNSVLLGQGYASAAELIADARIKFPSVMRRQPRLEPIA